MMEEKELGSGDLAWHAGMDAWLPLKDMESMASWLPRDPTAGPPPLPERVEWEKKVAESLKEAAKESEVSARRLRVWLRLAARVTDELIFYTVFWAIGMLGGWLGVWDFALRPPLLMVLSLVAWIPVEATLLHFFGTTPGKWLLGMRVCDDLGQYPSWFTALKRSALALTAGYGLGLPFVMYLPVITGFFSSIHYRVTGSTLWDQALRLNVAHRPVSPAGYVGVFGVFALWLAGGALVTFRAPFPANLPPEIREQIEKARQNIQESFDRMDAPKKQAPAAEA